MIEHDASTCLDPACEPCLNDERRESVIRLETALLSWRRVPRERPACGLTIG